VKRRVENEEGKSGRKEDYLFRKKETKYVQDEMKPERRRTSPRCLKDRCLG
jgi:hypothetical protein